MYFPLILSGATATAVFSKLICEKIKGIEFPVGLKVHRNYICLSYWQNWPFTSSWKTFQEDNTF